MDLVRRSDWPARLARFIAARSAVPFEYGKQDCTSFGIDWVRECTGVEVTPIDWTSEREALEAVRRAGGLRQAISSKLGQPRQNWREARRGDVGLTDGITGRDSVVVCAGLTWVGAGKEGLVHLPLARAMLVWQVG